MAAYKYSGFSMYLDNARDYEMTFRELALYVEALENPVNRMFGKNDFIEQHAFDNPQDYDQELMEVAYLFYSVDFGPGDIPQSKQSLQFEIDQNDRGYLYIPHSSKGAHYYVKKLYQRIYEMFSGPDLVQITTIFGTEYQNYNELTPKVMYKRP